MDLCELVAKKQWKQITLERTPESLAKELPMLEAIELAEILGGIDFYDDDMKNFSIKLLEATRAVHPEQWKSSWRYDAFLGSCYYFIFEPEKAFEAYSRAIKRSPPKPHPGLLVALAGCTDFPGDFSLNEEDALHYLKIAIEDHLYVDAVLLLRGIYRIRGDTINEEFWTEMLAKALKLGKFVPSLEQAVYETDEDDARTGWKYEPDIDMKRAKDLAEELRDVLPRPLDN